MDRHSHNVFVAFRVGQTDRRGEKRREEGEEERKTSEMKRFTKMFDNDVQASPSRRGKLERSREVKK